MIQKFRSFLRKQGIKSRMFLAFIVLPLGLMVLIFIVYYMVSVDIFITKNRQSSHTFVSLTEENIYLNTSKMEEELQSLSQRDFLFQIFDDPSGQDSVNTFQKNMNSNLYLKDRLGIQLFDKNRTLIYKERENRNYDIDEVVYDLEYAPVWKYDKKNNEIILVKKIYENLDFKGYLLCGFSQDAFSPSFSQLDYINNMLVIVDENGRYMFGSSNLKAGTYVDTINETMHYNEKEYYVEARTITGMKWKVVNLVASDHMLQEFHNFRNMILLYGIIILIILEIIATFVYRSIYDPLHNILKTMKTIDEEHLANMRVEDEGNDEIHEVATNFNELLDRVEELINTVENEQEQKRETQFQLLQAQINPHFLFNTLNTLHFLAIMNEDKPVSEGINALAKLLRNTIVDSKEQVSVKEELENLRNYIIIQKLRYGDLFETVYNVDEDVLDCQILKFLLQPIVENSILHAFEEDKEHQILTIRIQRQDNYLKIEIGDNGKGFDLHKMEPTNKNLSGIGIGNIQERIQLMYGEQYSMNIESVLHSGTIVTLLLPYVKGDAHV